MTDIPTALEINCETGETTIRPLTATEIADRDAAAAAYAAQLQAEADAAVAKAALKASAISKLTTGQPLTADEASVLVI